MTTYWLQFPHNGESLGAAIVEEADNTLDITIAQRAIDAGIAPACGQITIRQIRDEELPNPPVR